MQVCFARPERIDFDDCEALRLSAFPRGFSCAFASFPSQADDPAELPTQSVTEEQYRDENGHIVVKKVELTSVEPLTERRSTSDKHGWFVHCVKPCRFCPRLISSDYPENHSEVCFRGWRGRWRGTIWRRDPGGGRTL